MVIGSKVYVAWKQKVLHGVTLHDVIVTKQYIVSEIDGPSNFAVG